jgi:hypothetical protein
MEITVMGSATSPGWSAIFGQMPQCQRQPPATLPCLIGKRWDRREKMSSAKWVVLVQANGDKTGTRNPIGDKYFVIALGAVIVGLIVLVFIRCSFGRSSKR